MQNVCKLFAAAILFGILLVACSKNSSTSGTGSRLSFYLTDGPAAYDAVNVDIEEIDVNASNDSSTQAGWVSLPLNRKGVYNLLDLRNGLDTLLTSQALPTGTISQIRLVLGNNNSVVIKGVSYPLTTPSSQTSGLKLNVHATLVAGIEYKMWLDFDAGKSVVTAGANKYLLKPVIRTYTKATTGAVKGIVLPVDAHSWVYAIQNTNDTISSAIADTTSGSFLIGGLTAGSYKIAIAAGNYRDTVINATVTTGVITDAGTLQLSKQ